MSDDAKFLIPKKGLRVLDPLNMRPLPPEGVSKPWRGPKGVYWRRRVMDESVVIGTPPQVEVKAVEESHGRRRGRD